MKIGYTCILLGSARDRVEHFERIIRPRIPEIHPHAATEGRDGRTVFAISMRPFAADPRVDTVYARCVAACKRSHCEAIKDHIKDNDWLVVLEDDAMITDQAPRQIETFLEKLPSDCQLAYLFKFSEQMVLPTERMDVDVEPAKPQYSTLAYAVPRAHAERVCDLWIDSDPLVAADLVIAEAIAHGRLVAHAPSESIVTSAGQNMAHSAEGMPSNIWCNRVPS